MMGLSREAIRKETGDYQIWYNMRWSRGIQPCSHFRLARTSLSPRSSQPLSSQQRKTVSGSSRAN